MSSLFLSSYYKWMIDEVSTLMLSVEDDVDDDVENDDDDDQQQNKDGEVFQHVFFGMAVT
jgi:hypothetical protein